MNSVFPLQKAVASVSVRQQAQPSATQAVNSGEILRGLQELQINHGDSIYTLRITRQGKLILTK